MRPIRQQRLGKSYLHAILCDAHTRFGYRSGVSRLLHNYDIRQTLRFRRQSYIPINLKYQLLYQDAAAHEFREGLSVPTADMHRWQQRAVNLDGHDGIVVTGTKTALPDMTETSENNRWITPDDGKPSAIATEKNKTQPTDNSSDSKQSSGINSDQLSTNANSCLIDSTKPMLVNIPDVESMPDAIAQKCSLAVVENGIKKESDLFKKKKDDDIRDKLNQRRFHNQKDDDIRDNLNQSRFHNQKDNDTRDTLNPHKFHNQSDTDIRDRSNPYTHKQTDSVAITGDTTVTSTAVDNPSFAKFVGQLSRRLEVENFSRENSGNPAERSQGSQYIEKPEPTSMRPYLDETRARVGPPCYQRKSSIEKEAIATSEDNIVARKNKENENKTGRIQQKVVRKVIKKRQTPAAFWERSGLGRTHLRFFK